jgi:hypothetical protein
MIGILDLRLVLLLQVNIGVFPGEERIPPIGGDWLHTLLG